MLGFVQNLFAPRVNPIGVDFGTDCLRLAQVQYIEGDYRLIAAASCEIPQQVRGDPAAKFAFFTQALRKLLSQAPFRGRDVVLSLPASAVHIEHLLLPKTSDEELTRLIQTEARDKFPMDLSQAMVRHLVAGEITQGKDHKLEVIVMAVEKQWLGQYLAAALTAKIKLAGMNVEPMAVVDCFRHVYRRKIDAEVTHSFVDIGSHATRVVIARHGQILFARVIPIGGEHFTQATAAAMRMGVDEARQLRIDSCNAAPDQSAVAKKQQAGGPATALMEFETRRELPNEMENPGKTAEINRGCIEKIDELVAELNSCHAYYQSVFPEQPVERMIFIGGESRQQTICDYIANCVGIASRVGDPLCRMGRLSKVGIESGIDRRLPQPAWVVAIGLSMGPGSPEPDKYAFESDC